MPASWSIGKAQRAEGRIAMLRTRAMLHDTVFVSNSLMPPTFVYFLLNI